MTYAELFDARIEAITARDAITVTETADVYRVGEADALVTYLDGLMRPMETWRPEHPDYRRRVTA
jgi:hypothetical protein